MIRIAAIITKTVQQEIMEVIESLGLDCSFSYHTYSRFMDIPDIFASVEPSVQAVITSGCYPSQVIHHYFPDTKVVIREINVDDGDIFYFFLRLLDENRDLNLQRVFADVTEVFGCSLYDYLRREQKNSISELSLEYCRQMPFERLLNMESEMLGRHVEKWKRGETDISVTRFSSLVPKLRAQGIPTYFPMPSKRYITEVVQDTIRSVHDRQMEDAQAAVITVGIREATDLGDGDQQFETRQSRLYEAVLAYAQEEILNFVVHKYRHGVEITTDRKTVEWMTHDYSDDQLSAQLKQKLNFAFFTGYGLGQNSYEARRNSISALKKSMDTQSYAGYVINAEHELTGPLGSGRVLTLRADNLNLLNELADRANLSVMTVQRILAVADAAPERNITSHYIAERLSITARSANRMLKALLNTDLLEPGIGQKISQKGRPERVYRVKTPQELS